MTGAPTAGETRTTTGRTAVGHTKILVPTAGRRGSTADQPHGATTGTWSISVVATPATTGAETAAAR